MGMFDWLRQKTEADSVHLGQVNPKQFPCAVEKVKAEEVPVPATKTVTKSDKVVSIVSGFSAPIREIISHMDAYPDYWLLAGRNPKASASNTFDPLVEVHSRGRAYRDKAEREILYQGKIAMHSGEIVIDIEKYQDYVYDLDSYHPRMYLVKGPYIQGCISKPLENRDPRPLTLEEAEYLFNRIQTHLKNVAERNEQDYLAEIQARFHKAENGYQLTLDLRT